jgi:hypothetical protein
MYKLIRKKSQSYSKPKRMSDVFQFPYPFIESLLLITPFKDVLNLLSINRANQAEHYMLVKKCLFIVRAENKIEWITHVPQIQKNILERILYMDKIFSGTPINLTIGRFANEPIVSGFIRTMILKEISRKDNLPVSLNEIRLKIFSNGKYLFDDKFMESINYTTDILCELNEFLSIGYMEIDESVEAYGYSEIIKWIF